MMSTKPAHSDAIPNCLAEPEDEMVGLLGELISVPTENPPGRNYRACVNLLESCLRQRGFTCERVATEDLNDASGERSARTVFSRALRRGSGVIQRAVSTRKERAFPSGDPSRI